MFKKFHNEVENHIGKSIKMLKFDKWGEYLSDNFIDYLKMNGIISQWTPLGTP